MNAALRSRCLPSPHPRMQPLRWQSSSKVSEPARPHAGRGEGARHADRGSSACHRNDGARKTPYGFGATQLTQRNENRLRRLESAKRPQPYPEEDFSHCTEAELVAMRDAARAALAGDAEAKAELQRLLALTDARKLIEIER
jgi:hypothetical protein